MKVGIGADNRGAGCKKLVSDILKQKGHTVIDFGVHQKIRMDYANIACKVGFAIGCEEVHSAVLIGAMGSEMALAANKLSGIRAVACYDEMHARLAKEKLDCNILCLACELTPETLITKIVETWLSSTPANARYKRRLQEIQALEQVLHNRK